MKYAEFPESKAVAWAAYDGSRRILYVAFRDSMRTYAYTKVPRRIFDELLIADSKGTFVNQQVKPAYKFTEVAPPPGTPGNREQRVGLVASRRID